MDSPSSDDSYWYPSSSSPSSSSSDTSSESSEEEEVNNVDFLLDLPESIKFSFENNALHITQMPFRVTIELNEDGTFGRVIVEESHICPDPETIESKKRPLEETVDNAQESNKRQKQTHNETLSTTVLNFTPQTLDSYINEFDDDDDDEDAENIPNSDDSIH